MDLTLFLIAVIIIIAFYYFIKSLNELRDDIRKMKVCSNLTNKEIKEINTKEKNETTLLDGLKKIKEVFN